VAQSSSFDRKVTCVRIELFVVAALCAAGVVATQEIGWLDLTDTHPRDRIHAPLGAGGECGSGIASNIEVNITLVRLDKASYSFGEEVTYEVKIQNSGKEPIEIPWSPHLGDLEPADSSRSYTFLDAGFSLEFTEPDSNRTFSIYGNSYGSLEVPGSTRKLLPGEWIFVRVRQRVEAYEEWWWTKVKDSSPLNVRASASLTLSNVTYSPGEKSDSATDRYVCIPVGTKLGAPLEVALWPATSR
jgi:hypothetical protein